MKPRFQKAIPLMLSVLCLLSLLAKPSQADPRSMMGSGNFDLEFNSDFGTQYDVLNTNGVKVARINLYSGNYWNGSAPVTDVVTDNTIKQAYSKGITPMIHFSYYAKDLNQYNVTFGGTAKWYAIGRAFALRYAPNSSWLQSQGINNWGVNLYTAFNEPDLNYWWTQTSGNGVPAGVGIPINSGSPYVSNFGGNYHDNLAALSDGIKSVSSAIKVINGGFATPCSAQSYTAQGYASGVADLFNNGKLDGLNLHTYNDAKYASLYPKDGWDNEFAAFRQFGTVKSTSGITRDLDFYTDEFNYKNTDDDTPGSPGSVYDEDRTARNGFTCMWQNLGVTKNDGTSATKLALIWTLFFGEDVYRTFNNNTLTPYSPRKIAKAYAFIANQTAGMEYSTLDPFNTGEWTLVGGGKKIWVWTNMKTYTNHLGGDWTINGIPSGTAQLKVYGWDCFNGPRQTLNVSAGQTSATISGLAQNETYMVVSVPGTPTGTSNFSTTFESGQPQPTWSDSVDSSFNVAGYNAGINPECSTRTNEAATSGTALVYSGNVTASAGFCYYRVFSVNVPILSTTTISYDIYPQVANARYVGIDFLCSDGTVLRDSGATDSNGISFHPNAGHGGNIPLNAWTTIRGSIGNKLAGKTINKIWVAYDRGSGANGQYRGYIDNINIDSSGAGLLDGTYKIVNKNSGKALTVSGGSTTSGANIVQSTYNGANSQRWTFSSLGGGYYSIKNVNSGQVMDISAGSTSDGAANIQWPWNGGWNQHWSLTAAGNGYYNVVNRNSGKVLDISGASTADGAQDIQYFYTGGDNQRWSIVAP